MELLLLATLWSHHVSPDYAVQLECRHVQQIVKRLIRVEDMSQTAKIEVYRELKAVTPHDCAVEVLA
jgi:hypothetical protein